MSLWKNHGIRIIVMILCLVSLLTSGLFVFAQEPEDADGMVIEKSSSYSEPGFEEDLTGDRLYEYMLYLARGGSDAAAEEEAAILRAPTVQLFATEPNKAGDRLTGLEKTVYDVMEEKITQVANGDISTTNYTFTFTQLGIPMPFYSAEELTAASGQQVDSILEDGAVSPDAIEALCATVTLDTNALIQALMADHPYEMYWYDKTQGCYINFRYGCRVQYASDGSAKIALSTRSALTVSLYVANAYAGSANYTVDAGSITSCKVPQAVAEAQRIVAANRDKSDYEKLLAYKAYIENAVTYDHSAADASNHTPYGNPWQLISVFDSNSSTNVVCEGYSKAFQFLCDISDFDGDIHCISVTGLLDYDTGSGAHMWNILHMDDGKNYLVDVTNCDDGSIGTPDNLFLKGVSEGVRTGIDYTAIIPERRVGNVIFRADSVSYVYDANAKKLWSAPGFLILSPTAYDPSTSPSGSKPDFGVGTVTPTVSGNNISVSIPLNNSTKTAKNMTVFAAVYNSGGQLVGLQNVTVTVSPGGDVVDISGLTVPGKGTYTLKCMISDAANFAPIGENAELTVVVP